MSNAYQCWKAVYRLNHNWLMGQAKVTSLSILDMLKQDQLVLERLDGRHVIPSADAQSSFPPILKFKGSVIIVASPNNLVHLWRIRSSTSARPSFSGDSETSTIGCDDASQELEFWQTYIPSPAHESSEPMGRISYLALDRSTPSTTITSFVSCLTEQRVMVGYDSGHFSIFAYQDPSSIFQATDAGIPPLPPQHQLREIGNTTSLPAWSSEDRIQSAALHYPILVTCSNDGAISIYKIQDQYDPAAQEFETTTTKDPWCRLLHRLYGIASESPVEISLEQIRPGKSSQHNDDTDVATTSLSTSKETSNKGSSWRAIISFGLQLLDGSWTVRLQEIGFDNLFIHYSNETGTESAISISDGGGPNFEQQQYQPQHPSLAQHANYDDTVYGHFTNLTEMCESDFAFLSSSSATACTTPFDNQVRVGAISSMAISWPFVVTTHRDNTMNVFQMTRQRTHSDQSSKSSTASAATLGSKGASRLRLRFEHLSTLYGHCGAVSSVAIEPRSGRLVSAGMDRSIKVWALTLQPRRTQATLKSSSSSRSNYQGPSSLSTPRTHQCIVSMSDINKSWTETGKVTMEEGLGLIWVGSDEDKIVSMNCDGTVKVWQFS
ncbi:RNA-dependent ATPase rok1 [Gryganskiella cystojenkinii]|nr:RNA-dependent ATPase rok1 [Gryganskiella cystojenkinii]